MFWLGEKLGICSALENQSVRLVKYLLMGKCDTDQVQISLEISFFMKNTKSFKNFP